ncbi:MAG: hypothetical protein QOE75_1674 [Solirubrobacterales bacterium]|nr:hypothetical protein [Solirubrobacterales bacterium]
MRRRRQLGAVVGLGLLLAVLAAPVASGASDIWGNVAPAAPLGEGGLFGRYPLAHYLLDQQFTVVEASLTGVDVSGVPPMIAYFLASVLWALTAFLAQALISLFAFAFSLDLVNGSAATGGQGALAPVASAIHSIYANVFGAPWLVLAISVVGIWAMWKALVQRRYSETAGALGLSLIYVVLALFFVAQPQTTIGSASKWTNQMSEAFLSIAQQGDPSGGGEAKDAAANQLFDLLVFKPWVVLNFGGIEHCALSGTGSEDEDPESVAVRPLSSNPDRDAQLSRRLAAGTEVTADGKVCVNNSNKYAHHFLRFGLGTDERDDEYDALNHGDASKLPEGDPAAAGYRLGIADKPATDAMEEGGQYQRLLIAIVVFVGELGAFLLLGSLSVGIILAQVLLLLLLAFAPVALVAAVIPGRGHAFFRGWLEKLAGYLLRKAAYSLILAVLLAVNGALASATAQLGWLMSFGLQALFYWAVFLQRRNLSEGLIGIATGPGAPGRDNALRLVALYAGARTMGRPLRGLGRAARSAGTAPVRAAAAVGSRVTSKGSATAPGTASPPPRFGTSYSAPVGGGYPSMGVPGPDEAPSTPKGGEGGERPDRASAEKPGAPKGERAAGRDSRSKPKAGAPAPTEKSKQPRRQTPPPTAAPDSPPGPAEPGTASGGQEASLGDELRREREGKPAPKPPERQPEAPDEAPSSPPRRGRRRRKGGR